MGINYSLEVERLWGDRDIKIVDVMKINNKNDLIAMFNKSIDRSTLIPQSRKEGSRRGMRRLIDYMWIDDVIQTEISEAQGALTFKEISFVNELGGKFDNLLKQGVHSRARDKREQIIGSLVEKRMELYEKKETIQLGRLKQIVSNAYNTIDNRIQDSMKKETHIAQTNIVKKIRDKHSSSVRNDWYDNEGQQHKYSAIGNKVQHTFYLGKKQFTVEMSRTAALKYFKENKVKGR